MRESYSQSYVELWRGHWWWQSRHRIVLRELERWRAERQQYGDSREDDAPTLLDIGCAGGVAFDDWSRFGEVYGIEPDGQLIDPSSRWSDYIDHASFSGDYHSVRMYDVVLLLDVLEHIEDDDAALAKIFDLLKPGGILILTVPALPSLWSVHDDVNLHYRRYTKESLRSAIAQTDFSCRELRYLFGWSLGMVYARKWLARRTAEEYAVSIPPRPLNAAMRACSLAEAWMTTHLRIPVFVGSSLFAVLRRPLERHRSGTLHNSRAKV